MKVEVFYEQTGKRPQIQEHINEWLGTHPDINVKDIKVCMQSSGTHESFFAIVLYEKK